VIEIGERGIRRVLVDDRETVPCGKGLGAGARGGKGPVDAPVPKVIVPMGEPFFCTSSTVAAVALTPA
jgi:hypothetical protein